MDVSEIEEMNYKVLLALCICFFLTLKLFHTGIRMSDTNIYFETAHQMLQGHVLYKDIFFTNFPLFPYISVIYFILTYGHLSLFYLTASIEVILTSLLIFLIVKELYGRESYAFLASSLYLFSFLILTTSDHQTGVFSASLFAVGSYYLLLKKNYLWSGVLIGLALMTKAYFLPIAAALALSLLFKQSPKAKSLSTDGSSTRDYFFRGAQPSRAIVVFLAGAVIAILLVLLPSLLFTPHALWHDVFAYSLTRSQGIAKANIVWFFIKHDFLFFCVLLFSLFNWRKQFFFAAVSLFSILFFFLYKDMYYLYLNFLIPFLCIGFPIAYQRIEELFTIQRFVIPTILIIFFIVNILVDQKSFADIGQVPEIDSIVSTIQKLHPTTLYGMNDITPGLSYLTNTPQLEGIVDTNENIYRKGFLDTKGLTKQAIQRQSLLIAHGAYYPEQGIDIPLIGEIFDLKQIRKSCKLVNRFPVKTEGIENQITLFSCQE